MNSEEFLLEIIENCSESNYSKAIWLNPKRFKELLNKYEYVFCVEDVE